MPIRQFKTCGYCETGLPLNADGEIDKSATVEAPEGRLHPACALNFTDDYGDDLADAVYDRLTDRYLGV